MSVPRTPLPPLLWCIAYSYRGSINSAEDILKALVQDGLSEVELMGGPIQAFAGMGGDIELEYKIPQGSDCVAEVAKCLQYCKEALA